MTVDSKMSEMYPMNNKIPTGTPMMVNNAITATIGIKIKNKNPTPRDCKLLLKAVNADFLMVAENKYCTITIISKAIPMYQRKPKMVTAPR